MPDPAFRVAIIGAGPSGFYAAAQLLAGGAAVDLYDELPTPFGLVRSGVAPDHPKIKTVTRVYEKTAKHPDFRFFGGVKLGDDVEPDDLRSRYDAVVHAFGTPDDNRLDIPGEDRPGSHSATAFVAWYNGHPEHADAEFPLHVERAVVIGNGNVAVDVARMLVLDPDELAPTDTADHAIDHLGRALVTDVVLLGRRGPAQAAFTTPELRELGELARADIVVRPEDLELDEASAAWLEQDGEPTNVRNVELLREYAARERTDKTHSVELRFLASPVALLGEGDDGPVTGVRIVRNRIEAGTDGRLRAVATEEEETIECGLVLRSIGYRGRPLPGVPYDERKGRVANDGGRVTTPDGDVVPGDYVVGWAKRGPSGVIGTNKKDSLDTVKKLLADHEAGLLPAPTVEDASPEATEAWLRERVPHVVTWDDWGVLDAHETAAGEPQGRPRVKVVRVEDMHDVLDR